MTERKEGKMLSFAEIKDYVDYWCDQRRVELRNVHKSTYIDKDPQDTTKPVVLNGIGFHIWLEDGKGRKRPTNRKLMGQMCADESTQTDHTISVAQARGAVLNWLNDRASELLSEEAWNLQLDEDGYQVIDIFDATFTEVDTPLSIADK